MQKPDYAPNFSAGEREHPYNTPLEKEGVLHFRRTAPFSLLGKEESRVCPLLYLFLDSYSEGLEKGSCGGSKNRVGEEKNVTPPPVGVSLPSRLRKAGPRRTQKTPQSPWRKCGINRRINLLGGIISQKRRLLSFQRDKGPQESLVK